jgi:transposase
VDEGGFAPSVTRRYAYAPKGQRVYGLTPGQRTPRTSLIAARMDGEVQGPFLFEGTGDTEVFTCWLETLLCPRLTTAHVVIMDNATFHKSSDTSRLIAETGATLLFLSPYSPDFNPIEHDFAALKKNREYNAHDTLDTIVKHYQSFGA